jgi:hypothetical protein
VVVGPHGARMTVGDNDAVTDPVRRGAETLLGPAVTGPVPSEP